MANLPAADPSPATDCVTLDMLLNLFRLSFLCCKVGITITEPALWGWLKI